MRRNGEKLSSDWKVLIIQQDDKILQDFSPMLPCPVSLMAMTAIFYVQCCVTLCNVGLPFLQTEIPLVAVYGVFMGFYMYKI